MRLFFVTSISKISLSQYWVRPVCSSTPTTEVWTEFKKPQAPAALTETGEEHRGPRHFSSVSGLPIPDLRAVRWEHPVSAPQKSEPFRGGDLGPHRLFAKVYVCDRGTGSSVPEPSLLFAPDRSRRAAASEGRHWKWIPQPAPQSRVGPRSPRLGRKGRGPGPARRGRRRVRRGGSSPARPAAEFPARSPASCVLWSRPPPLPCWIVRLPPPPLPPPREEGWRRSWEFSAVAGVRGQRPSGQSPAGRELGASLAPRGPPSAPPSRGLPPPPGAGGVERDAAPLTPLLPPLSPRGGTSARPLAGGHGPGLPAPPATP